MGKALVTGLFLIFAVTACGDNLDPSGQNNNGGPDAPGNGDGDAPLAIDAPAEVDAAVGVACGAATCGSGMECCVQGMNRTCVASGSCNGVNFDCDGPEDCATAGQVCCFAGGGGPGGGSTCTDAAGCATPTCAGPQDCPAAQAMCCAVGQLQVCLAACPP